MSELVTVRERVKYASQYFEQIHGVVLTTFNLNSDFLEMNALPNVLNIEGSGAALNAELHSQLSQIPCTVFYDPTTDPKISGRFRYVAQPVPLPKRFFHPKLVIIAGESENGTTWVYLAVSSANLTLSGWGRNAESFGETWIHTQKQQPWGVLHGFLDWLDTYCELKEKQGAIEKIRNTLNNMPNRRRFNTDAETVAPWATSLYASLYVSVIDDESQGLAAFLRRGRTRRPDELWVYSPYWSDVTKQIKKFNAQSTKLFPALSADGKPRGLTRKHFAKFDENTFVTRNEKEDGGRFWHMKAYWTRFGDTERVAVGSCNFTSAGLVGGDQGNVEAMLVFDNEDCSWLPNGDSDEDLKDKDFSDEIEAEEGVLEPTPVAIVVVWDWEEQSWRWWLKPSEGQSEFKLQLPNLPTFSVEPPVGKKAGKHPRPGAKFTVLYKIRGEQKSWQGHVVEFNLIHSRRSYGKPLSATEILESWRGSIPPSDSKSRTSHGFDDDDHDELEQDPPAAFDAVNLYDLYRSTKMLRERLRKQTNPTIQRSFLVGRADSAMSLAYLADRDQEAPVVRYLILKEIYSIVSEWAALFEENEITVVENAEKIANRAREQVQQDLEKELPERLRDSSDHVLEWFEHRLSKLDVPTSDDPV